MPRRVLVAKKRGRLVGALLGGVLAGPIGALAGAVLNSKTDYYEEEPKAPPSPDALKMGTAGKIAFWFIVIFFVGALIMLACGVTLH
jgi:hypothetical protein